MSTFIDFHILQSVPPSCVNRDDNNAPKSAYYGGVKRARVSSQAWKRAMREEFKNYLDSSKLGYRTVHIVELVVSELEKNHNQYSAEEIAKAACSVLKLAEIRTKAPKKSSNSKNPAKTHHPVTEYLLFVSPLQIEALSKLTLNFLNGEKPKKEEALSALDELASVDIALFGRMIADAPSLNFDAACQVSHALGVTSSPTEFDYFTACDDLQRKDNMGAGMIGTVEFVSSTFYRYATINVDALVKSLGSSQAALEAVKAFIPVFTLSMPTGKQSTFANRTRPGLIIAQVREDQPVNLAEAFEQPVTAKSGTLSEASYRLVKTAIEQDRMFNSSPVATYYLASGAAAQGDVQEKLSQWGESQTFDTLVKSVAETISSHIEV